MSYTKTVWRNNQAPAINADNLNHIEQGIESAHNQMAINTSDIETLTTQVQGNATNIASEISARQSGDSSLQSQIDQIIAPTGEAPSAAEVENARIGATSLGSVTYDTLGNAIRGQVTDLNNAISQTDAQLGYFPSVTAKTSATAWRKVIVIEDFTFKANNTYLITFKPTSVITVSSYGYIRDSNNTEIKAVQLKDLTQGYIEYTPVSDKVANIVIEDADTTQRYITVSIDNLSDKNSIVQMQNAFALLSDEMKAIKSTSDGFPSINYLRGNIDSSTGVINTTKVFRIFSKNIEVATSDITVTAKTGYQFFVVYYSSGVFTNSSSFVTSITIPSGTEYRLVIGATPEDGTIVADIYTFASNIVSTYNTMNQIVDIQNTGLQNLNASRKLFMDGYSTPPYIFKRGYLLTGVYKNTISYRVAMVDYEYADYDCDFTAKTGFKFGVYYYNGSNYVDSGWVQTFHAPKGLKFIFQIARETEDVTEIANVEEFVNAISVNTSVSDLIDETRNIGASTLYQATSINYSGTAFHRDTLFAPITLEKNHSYLFKVKYAEALSSTAYLYIVKSDSTDYKTYAIGASGTTEFTLVFTPTAELQNALLKVGFGQTSLTASFELMEARTTQSLVDMNYKHISRESLPKQTLAIGHAGAYSGVYQTNTIENAMYNVINHGFKAIECDVKMTSDYVPVISHEGTVEYEGVTYNINEITYAQATTFGLKPLEPFVQCSKRYGFRLFIDSPFSSDDYENQCDALLTLLQEHGSTANIMVVVNQLLANTVKYLVSKDPTIGVGLIYFRQSYVKAEDVAELQNMSNGEVSVWFELDNAITTDDADYINAWRAQGVSFGMFTIYLNGGYDPVVETKAWADLVDYIITEYNETPSLLMTYDFPN